MDAPPRQRIAILSRYNLADTYAMTAEFQEMLGHLTAQTDVLFLSMRGPRAAEPPAGVTVEALPVACDRSRPGDIQRKGILMYLLLPWVAHRLCRFRPDLIFLVDNMPQYSLLLRWLTRRRVGTMYGDWTIHNFFGRRSWGKPLLSLVERLDRFEMRRLDGFFCRANAAADRLKSWGIHPAKVRVIRDAPHPDAFTPRNATILRQRCGFADDDVVLLYHGVMHQGKGLDRLLTWAQDLHADLPSLGMIFVGGGPEEAALRRQAEASPMARRTIFTGWLPTVREVGDYCCAADICIAMRTADEANQGIVPGALLHSMACGKVVVAPRLRGTSEIIRHGENGFMFEADNGDDFKRLIRYLVEHRGEWATVGRHAWEDIRDHYSVAAVARQYAEALVHFASLRV